MATLRQIRDRVRSLRNTQQITRAMKMVAGAKIRRAELAMRAARPYASAMNEMLQTLVSTGGAQHPLLERREVHASGILAMTADKGLAGAFNSNLVRAAVALGREQTNARFYLVGIKGRVQIRALRLPVERDWALQSKPFAELAKEVANRISDDFLSGRVDEMTLVASKFVSTMVQRPTRTPLLPILQQDAEGSATATGPKVLRNAFEFEPDPKAVLAALLPKYLEFTIFQALLETQASEFAARLIAMTNATDNAGKLIDDLTLVMNKTRQATITKEILEIVGGAEALKS
jgi:F-type H+-transporting ATPase subunit gamma